MNARIPLQSASRKHNRNAGLWLAAALIGLMVGWRFLALPHTYMRDDEEIAFRTTQYTLAYAVEYQANQDIQAPLWFALFRGWQQVAGATEFAGRVFSILWTALTLACFYRLAWRWTKQWAGQWAATLSLLALSVSTYFWVHSLEIRPYPLVMLCAVLCMGAFWQLFHAPTRRNTVLYGASLALCAYVHYFLAFLIIGQLLFLVFRRASLRTWAQGGVSLLIAGVLFLPWLPAFTTQIQTLRELAQAAGQVYGTGLGTTSTAEPTNVQTASRLLNAATNGLPLVYLLALVTGGVLLWRRVARTAWSAYLLALLWGIGVPAIALLLNTVAAVYAQRYVSYLSPGLALAVGITGAAVLANLRARPALRKMALAGGVLFVAANLLQFSAFLPVRVPLRDLFQGASADMQPGDVIYLLHGGEVDPFVQWHMRAYLPSDVEITTELARAVQARRVWFMTFDWFSDEVRAAFARLEPSHPVQEVIGQCDRQWCYLIQEMTAPPLQTPTIFTDAETGGQLPFYGMDVEAVSDDRVDVRLWWRVDDVPLTRDYSIGLFLLDEQGIIVAQTDGPIFNYGVETVQTSAMQPGRIYVDWRTLTPADVPAGDYTLSLAVYRSWDGVRLRYADGDLLSSGSVTLP